jgi:NTE family protein
MTDGDGEAALVLGGGGARCAYQAGVLWGLSRRLPALRFPILTGTSAGAINLALLGNHPAAFGDAAGALARTWAKLAIDDVFHATPLSLLKQLLRTGVQLTVRAAPGEGVVQGMVDTSALRQFLQHELRTDGASLPGLAANLRSGRLTAVAITATSYSTGEAVTFCAGRRIQPWRRPQRMAVATELTLDHVMASSALPLFYPAVAVDGAWYGDGEIGLVTPLAPALHLGAGRILAISSWADHAEASAAESARHPAPGEVMGVLYSAIFGDRLAHDAAQLERVNRLVRGRPASERHGHREAALLVIRPTVDLGALACAAGVEVPRSLRFLARGLDLQRARSRDLLSVVMLDHAFIARLVEIGERDGERRADEVGRFLAS